MKKTIVISLFLSVLIVSARGQKHQKNAINEIARPKLVIGIVVDQMRWDYLYRYYDWYSEGGFRRLLRESFTFENAMINYVPSYTAVGHATIYTGSVPSIHGIAGNTWYDFRSEKHVYGTDDARWLYW